MNLTRRRVMQGAAVFGLLGTRSWAVTEAAFDDFLIRSVSDGKLVLPVSFLTADQADLVAAATILSEAGIGGDSFDAPLNLTLMTRGDALILFDAGSGPDFMPTAGKLPDALEALGVAPDQITHVVFTHAHPDHIWGVLDDFDEPLFTNARYFMNRVERDYWLDPATIDQIDPARLSFVAGATRRIEALGDRLEVFEDGDEVLDGIRAVMTPGHTPGHTSFDLAGKGFVTGDAISNAHLAFRRPDMQSGSDQDPEMAATTRVNLLNRLAESGSRIIGYHLPDGGIGTVQRQDDAFAFVAG